MNDELIALCDATVTRLNGLRLSLAFKAERAYTPIVDIDELAHVTILVVPRSEESERLTRGNVWKEDRVIDVGILRKLPTKQTDAIDRRAIDALMFFRTEIKAALRPNLEVYDNSYGCVAIVNTPVFRPDHLQQRQFTSVLSVSYQGVGD